MNRTDDALRVISLALDMLSDANSLTSSNGIIAQKGQILRKTGQTFAGGTVGPDIEQVDFGESLVMIQSPPRTTRNAQPYSVRVHNVSFRKYGQRFFYKKMMHELFI